jgi:hypothetical protein
LTIDKSVKLTPLAQSAEQKIDLSGKTETIKTDVKLDDKNLPDTAREFIFDSLKGDIITTGDTPYISLSSYQHSTAKFVIADPYDTLRPQIAKLENVEIEAGFVNGYKINKFVGVIYNIGRRLPGGTEIEAIDMSAQLAQTTTGALVQPTLTPRQMSPQLAHPPTSSFKVKSTFTGMPAFYGKGDQFNGTKNSEWRDFDTNKFTAAHKTLASTPLSESRTLRTTSR